MGAMIRRVVDAVNVNEAARGTEGEFTFEVVCGTVEMSRVFEEHYFDTAEGTEGEHVWYANGQSPGTSPAVSTGSPKRCESCGLSGKGQLTSMTTPPRECCCRATFATTVANHHQTRRWSPTKKPSQATTKLGWV